MSENSNTEQAADISDESRMAVFYIKPEHANEILKSFGVPVPDASELDEIRLVIRASSVV